LCAFQYSVARRIACSTSAHVSNRCPLRASERSTFHHLAWVALAGDWPHLVEADDNAALRRRGVELLDRSLYG
jgi:hypothetical protein